MTAVVFDVFGTLISYPGQRINPYRHLYYGAEKRLPFLTRDVDVNTFAEELGLAHLIPVIRRELAEELSALRLFDDVEVTLRKLRARGMKIGVCSNLAAEYGHTVRTMLPGLDAFIFSYEVGAKKPDPKIYEEVCHQMGCRPREVLFIGDSKRADFEGPMAFGMHAQLLDRKGGQSLSDALKFL